MILCFSCSPETKQKMDALIERGRYRDYGELVSVAVDNLILLAEELGDRGALVILGDAQEMTQGGLSDDKRTSVSDTGVRVGAAKISPGILRGKHHSAPVTMKQVEHSIPSIFRSVEFPVEPTIFAQPADDEITAGQEVSIDRWLFGQFNKLLPAKVNCRSLAHLTKDSPVGVSLEDATLKISDAAADFGAYLAEHDRKYDIGRDEAFSTAFPQGGPGGEKSRLRYGNQFVGTVNSRGQLSGLLFEYKLANLSGSNPDNILLTRAGWDFALMPNAVLDEKQNSLLSKFSTEETEWVMEHIRRNVPVEYFAFRSLLTAIASGADTPEKLDVALAGLIPRDSGRSLSTSYLASQRSGAISRMADLGLLKRLRSGVRVSYSVTDVGIHYIDR